MRKAMNFLTGAVLGGLVGAGLALLFAPSSGADFQFQIQTRVDEIRENMTDAAADRRAELESHLADLRAPKPREEETNLDPTAPQIAD